MVSSNLTFKAGIRVLPLLSFLTLLLPAACGVLVPFTASPLSAPNQNVSQNVASTLRELIGTGNLDVNLLQGSQFGNQQIQNLLKDAGWIFYPDGKFVFISSQLNDSKARPLSLSGTYIQENNRLVLQAEQKDTGSYVALDGIIYREENNWVLDGIYVNSSWSSPRQIARITQSLTQQPPGSIKRPIIRNAPELQTQSNRQPVPELLNLPKVKEFRNLIQFELTFEGKTEAGTFNSLPGFLFIAPSKNSQPPSYIGFGVNSELLSTNGGFYLNTGEKVDPSIQIEGNEHRFSIEFKPSEKMRQLNWWTLSAGKLSADPVPVVGEAATVHLSIQGENVIGEIQARGISSDDQPSTYEAKITGKVLKSQLTERLSTRLATSSFDGQWEAYISSNNGNTELHPFGQIELQQNGQQVNGSFTGRGGGTIEGKIVAQNWLQLTWKDRQGNQGWGFFRAVANGGTLAGLWGNQGSKEQIQSLIAKWQLPADISAKTLSPLDAQELRTLSHQLGIEGRCEPAVALLDKSLMFYKNEQYKPETTPLNQNWYSSSIGFSLAFLMNCNLQIGDYDRLLENLTYFVDVQRFLEPNAAISRFFRQRTASLVKQVKSQSEMLAIFQKGFSEWKKLSTGNPFIGRIGVSLEKDDKTQAIFVSEVLKNEPAATAGILPKDIVTKIDERSTQGMNIEQVSEHLRGIPETPVRVTVQRGDQELAFQLIRNKVAVYPLERQSEFTEELAFLADYLANLQARLNSNLDEISKAEAKIAQGKLDPVQAWLNLADSLKRQKGQIDVETDAVIKRGRILFKQQKKLLQDVDTILQALPRSCDLGKVSEINMRQLRERDNHIDQILEADPKLTLLEKGLFRTNIDAIASLITLSLILDCDRKTLVETDIKKRFEENKKGSQEILNQIDEYIDSYRKKLISDVTKIDALEKGQPFFQKLIPLLVDLGDDKGALLASEKSRARAFADLLSTRLSISQATAESPTLEQVKQIAKTQAATLVEYSIIQNAGKESELLIWVVQPTGEIRFVRQDLKPLQSTLEGLAKDSACSDHSQLPEHGLAKLIQATHCNIRASLYTGEDVSPKLKQLHKLLIQPIANLLPNDSNAHVVFIPHQQLFLVPFPALMDVDGKYLIEKHTILTAPAIQVLDSTHQLQRRNAGVTKDILVVGNPAMPTRAGESLQPLDSLPNSEKEAIAIANLFNTKALTGYRATKAAILQQLPKARIIHLATHAEANDVQGLKSWIALAPTGQDTGFLTAADIFNLYGSPQPNRLQAELIVLSACTTGRGQVTGDGVIGLSRSLIAAGIPSVVVSLWSVQDPATEFLMKAFYQNLHLGRAQALRKAMLKTMKEYSSRPGAWAAFTLIGEP